MATGRTHPRFNRVYIDGYDLSGYARAFGPSTCEYEEGTDDVFTLDIKRTVPGQANVSPGTLNGIFDNTATSGLHIVMNGTGGTRDVMRAVGIRGVPADNDPVFSGQFNQLTYSGKPEDNPVAATVQFGNKVYDADNSIYARPWGVLLHASAAETGANSAIGLDQEAQTTAGGWMMYQVFAGNGTATIKVQDADTNLDGSFGDLLTSGVIDCSSVQSGVIADVRTATVERYVRWQVTLGTATTVTFAISWHRGL